MGPDFFGAPTFSTGMTRRTLQFLPAETFTFVDSPSKIDPANISIGNSDTLTHRFLLQLAETQSEAVSFSFYWRSVSINTEIGVRVESPNFAERVLAACKVDALAGIYQVELRPSDAGACWIAVDAGSLEELDVGPDTSAWLRLRLMLLSSFVPESQL